MPYFVQLAYTGNSSLLTRNPELCLAYRILLMSLALAALVACGGNAAPAPAISTPSSTPPSSSAGPAAPVNAPAIVNAAAGANASGVNITVGPPASATPPNAQDLGVGAMTGSIMAFNTGTTIAQGSTPQRVVLFGPGLSGDMTVTVRGPNDIQVSNVSSTTASDKTPGISFVVTVAANAALGARTVVLQAPNGDITTFTGGLEVVP